MPRVHACEAPADRLRRAPGHARAPPDALDSSCNRRSDLLPLRQRASASRRFNTGDPLDNPTRERARIVPPSPITVAIDDENGLPLGYGVIANVSDAGGCIWTDSHLEPGARLSLRVSFSHPAEVHEAAGLVVWAPRARTVRDPGCSLRPAVERRLVGLREAAARGRPRSHGRAAHARRGTGPVPRTIANG